MQCFKSVILYLTCALILCLCAACDDNENSDAGSVYEVFNGYYAIPSNKVVIIEDGVEFDRIFGNVAQKLKPVDFKKRNLLMVRGEHSNEISEIRKSFERTDDGYRLTVYVRGGYATSPQPWAIAYLVSKDIDPEDVELQVVVL